MPLDLQRFTVTIANQGVKPLEALETDAYTQHTVAILHADQLAAEQAGPRYGMADIQTYKLGYVTLWCWFALKRMGVDVPEFPLFKEQCLSVDVIKGDAVVDPTPRGAGTPSP